MPQSQMSYQPDFTTNRWSPRSRAIAALTGAAALAGAFKSKGWARVILDALGLSLTIRAITNSDVTQLIGVFLSPTIRLHRTVIVHAPVHEVYLFWTRFENYPKFMSFVREVQVDEQGTLLWELEGPAGVALRWNTRVSEMRADQCISWRSVPGSLIRNTGDIRFEELDREHTWVDVELSYWLHGGALGFAIAHVLGFDPRDRIDGDLHRMKELVEAEWRAKTGLSRQAM
jgi:uncharacterized membrane protein